MNTKPLTIVRIGLALAFLANSLNAFFYPAEFVELINGSFLSKLLPITAEHFVILIGINDGLLFLLLILGLDLAAISVWATFWIAGAMVIRGLSIDTLEESGFLFMAIALIIKTRNQHLRSD